MNQEKVLKLQALAPAEYLTGDEVIDLSHPSIRRFAGTLRAEHADDVSFARAAFVYARDGVRHSWDVQDPRVTDCVPASGLTPLRVMLCVVHYAVRAWAVSITPVSSGRGVRAVGSDGVSMAMEVSDR